MGPLVPDLSSPHHKTHSIACVQSLTDTVDISYYGRQLNTTFYAEAHNLPFNYFRAT